MTVYPIALDLGGLEEHRQSVQQIERIPEIHPGLLAGLLECWRIRPTLSG